MIGIALSGPSSGQLVRTVLITENRSGSHTSREAIAVQVAPDYYIRCLTFTLIAAYQI